MATVGFVSTRFAGLDGVTLETAKLADVARRAGHEIVWFAGELGPEFAPGWLEPDAHFDSDANRELQAACFGRDKTPEWARTDIRRRTKRLVAALDGFVDEFDVDVIVAQNSSTIPMQLPLGLATADLIARRSIPAVAHHHDFWWERERFTPTGVPDVLEAAFPPASASMRHMVINTLAHEELAARRGIDSVVLPNVMDFEEPPPPGKAAAFRRAVGLSAHDLLILQPTRIIPRKCIEDTIELAAGLGPDAVVVITHAERDEGDAYAGLLEQAATRHEVRLVFHPLDESDGVTLADAYAAADLVSFPSRIEGFGNALLETCYYRKPLLVRRYPVYVSDIAPTGLRAIEIDDQVTNATLEAASAWLADPSLVADIVAHNYAVCAAHFSYRTLRERFLPLLASGERDPTRPAW